VDLRLPSGLTIQNTEQRLAAFLAEEWPYYDGVVDDRPNEVTPVDVLAPVFVNAYFRSDAASLRLLHTALSAAWDPLLFLVPVSADLRTFDTQLELVRDLLHAGVALRNVLIPVATKVLFRKRRELIPILDNDVIGYYANALGQRALINRSQDTHHAEVVADVGVTVLRAFRRDLVGVYDTVCELSRRSAEQGWPVGPVRVLEILVWAEVEKRRYYRQ
jgi:hypothetical protein